MNEKIRAALLSGLVIPGAGQLYRGRRLKGILLLLLVTILLVVTIVVVASMARDFLQATGGAGNEAILAGILRERVTTLLWIGGAFVCLWIYGVADALLDSGGKDRSDEVE